MKEQETHTEEEYQRLKSDRDYYVRLLCDFNRKLVTMNKHIAIKGEVIVVDNPVLTIAEAKDLSECVRTIR